MFCDVPPPVGSVAAKRALKRLFVEMANYVDMKPGCSRCPERAVGTLVNLNKVIVELANLYLNTGCVFIKFISDE